MKRLRQREKKIFSGEPIVQIAFCSGVRVRMENIKRAIESKREIWIWKMSVPLIGFSA